MLWTKHCVLWKWQTIECSTYPKAVVAPISLEKIQMSLETSSGHCRALEPSLDICPGFICLAHFHQDCQMHKAIEPSLVRSWSPIVCMPLRDMALWHGSPLAWGLGLKKNRQNTKHHANTHNKALGAAAWPHWKKHLVLLSVSVVVPSVAQLQPNWMGMGLEAPANQVMA